MNKKLVQEQFSASAEAYATSRVHAHGASLDRLLELTRPQPGWKILDIATGAGHTALKFAPLVEQVTAFDLTYEMLAKTREQAERRGITNVFLCGGEAEKLPFGSNIFDLVTCRIAPHHFSRVDLFVSEALRVLKPDGLFAVVDNMVPGTRLHGKKARLLNDTGDYINAYERLRDPSHIRCLSLDEWQAHFSDCGFHVLQAEVSPKTIDFEEWIGRVRVASDSRIRLQVMLKQAPEPVLAFLNPREIAGKLNFELSEGLILGLKPGKAFNNVHERAA